MEKWLGTFDSLGQTFDSSGECFASLRSEKQLSPSESKVCPLESKVCLTIFPSLASIFHVVGTYILTQLTKYGAYLLSTLRCLIEGYARLFI